MIRIHIEPRSRRAMERVQKHGDTMFLLRTTTDGIVVRSIPANRHVPPWEGFLRAGHDVVWEKAQ